jgi:hypothetical protein
MRKINYLAIVLFMIVLSCGKDNPQPTTPIVTTTTSSGSSTTSTTSTTTTKKDCEINHQGTLKIVNTTNKNFYIYIEDVYVMTCNAGMYNNYNKVPAHSGLTVKVIDINDYSDVRTVDMPFYDCTTTQVNID